MTMRRALASLLLVLGLAGLLASPGVAFAQRSDAGINALKFLDAAAEKGGLSSGIKGEGFSSEDAVLGIIGNIVNVILGFVGIIFFIQMFYAGFRWMSSGGNEEIVTESRQTIKSAVIGIVVVFAAFVVTNFVLNQIASITGPTRPSIDLEGLSGDDVYCSYTETGPICEVMSRNECLNDIGGAIVSRSECEQITPEADPSLDIPGSPPDLGELPDLVFEGRCDTLIEENNDLFPLDCDPANYIPIGQNLTEEECTQAAAALATGGFRTCPEYPQWQALRERQ